MSEEDKALWKFVAEFVGWENLNWHEPFSVWFGSRPKEPDGPSHYGVPMFVQSVDAWLFAAWPCLQQLGPDTCRLWLHKLNRMHTGGGPVYVGFSDPQVPNATAKQRCQALYEALDGKLPIKERIEP